MAATLQERFVKCGRNCRSCPHGPYLYSFQRRNGKLTSKYLGKKSIADYLKEQGQELGLYDAIELTAPDTRTQRQVYGDALAVLDLYDEPPLTREKARKKLWNRLQLPSVQNYNPVRHVEAFNEICRFKGWKPMAVPAKFLVCNS